MCRCFGQCAERCSLPCLQVRWLGEWLVEHNPRHANDGGDVEYHDVATPTRARAGAGAAAAPLPLQVSEHRNAGDSTPACLSAALLCAFMPRLVVSVLVCDYFLVCTIVHLGVVSHDTALTFHGGCILIFIENYNLW